MTEPQQGASYDTQLTLAKAAEALGFDGRSDHYHAMSGDGLPGPTGTRGSPWGRWRARRRPSASAPW